MVRQAILLGCIGSVLGRASGAFLCTGEGVFTEQMLFDYLDLFLDETCTTQEQTQAYKTVSVVFIILGCKMLPNEYAGGSWLILTLASNN